MKTRISALTFLLSALHAEPAHAFLFFPSNNYTMIYAESAEIDPAITYQPRDTNIVFDCTVTGCAQPNYLFVMLPAADGAATSYHRILSTMAGLGIRSIGLNYQNNNEIYNICGTDDTCYDIARRDRVVGSDESPYVNSTADGLVNRLHGVLRRIGWNDFYDPVTQELLTERIIIGGDGQGAGMAAWIAKKVPLARVCQFSGTWDHTSPPNGTPPTLENWRPASWLTQPSQTPSAKIFGFAYRNDILTDGIGWLALNWIALGMAGQQQGVSDSTPPVGQMIGTAEIEPGCELSAQKRHECAVKDEVTPLLADGVTPKYRDKWIYACTHGLLRTPVLR